MLNQPATFKLAIKVLQLSEYSALIYFENNSQGAISMRATEIPKLGQLSKPEKILLVEDLWDNISVDDSDVPVPQSHKDELNRRSARHAKSPGNLLTLRQLQERVAKHK